ncbi:hypothetical protein LI012_07455 [Caldibacillus thermoamylovorans]|uniref:hypothetical protein n=2 Tax=Bacillales TaxID=1385 RepID=UPI001D072A2A|nr:hypothetical protein [Caldibacillus thermoamylovorans]MCB5934583.1 hypothetical protein [Bacillus sp. DFI.2.34]MCB7076665.1 hypothetical protein [Caldibacillus thermoamylovorans]MCM3478871.1 hypothetical protein [Caldibacillus thermoamylovorans]
MYKIHGVISSFIQDGKDYKILVKGTEGFLVRLKKIGKDEEYNLWVDVNQNQPQSVLKKTDDTIQLPSTFKDLALHCYQNKQAIILTVSDTLQEIAQLELN